VTSAALNRRLSGDPALQSQLSQAARMGRIGRWLLLAGLLPLAAWLALAPMASAVVATAHVKVDLDRRPVQHMEGGTVREVMVRDGQQVEAGQPLLALGDVAVDADARRLEFRWLSERAGVARLEAEVAGAGVLRYPQELLEAGEASPDVAAQLSKEQALFDTRRRTVRSQVQLLQDQGERIGQEMAHLRAQITEGEQSLRHQVEELERNRALVQDGFIAGTRISQLESSVADYRARLEERHSELARAGQRLIDTRLRAQALEGEYRQQASDLLKAANGRVTEIEQELRKVRDAARRQVVTAPAAGTVINLRFNGAGGVIQPREPIADLVPRQPAPGGGGADPARGREPRAPGARGAHQVHGVQRADHTDGGWQGVLRGGRPHGGPQHPAGLVRGAGRGRPSLAESCRPAGPAGRHAGRGVHPGRAAHAAAVPGRAGDAGAAARRARTLRTAPG